MRHGSAFSGAGGGDLGFERAGWRPMFNIEIADFPASVLRRHWPDVAQWRDIRAVDPDELPGVDAISGGFPCQDVSVAGLRKGLAGVRSGLYWEFDRILRGYRDAGRLPRWVLIENVPGLLSSHGGRDMGAILGALGKLGFHVAWRVLDAQYFGLAQRRKRLFIVGDSRAGSGSLDVLFDAAGSGWDSKPGRAAGSAIARSLTASTGGISAKEQQHSFVVGSDDPGAGDSLGVVAEPIGFRKATKAHGSDDAERWEQADVANALTLQGDSSGMLAYAIHPDLGQGADLTARETEISQTLPRKQSDRLTLLSDGGYVRRLTEIEYERLQGFPDGWTETGAVGERISRSQRYQMMGNAMPVPVIEWIARRMAAA